MRYNLGTNVIITSFFFFLSSTDHFEMNFLLFLLIIPQILCHSPFNTRKTSQFRSIKSSVIDSNRKPFEIIYQWRLLDFQYPTIDDRQTAITNGEYIPQNNLPLGVDTYKNRLFVTMPRWKQGVPFSLGWLPLPAIEESPAIQPYPNWNSHTTTKEADCTKLMSVYRLFIDECQRLWVIDSGIVNATILPNQICPPKIVVFDLKTDEKLISFEIPAEQVRQDSLHTNIIVDIRDGKCDDAYAYVADVWRYGLIVFSLAGKKSWRTTNHFYLPNPTAADYNLHGLNFQWIDGIFGTTLSPVDRFGDRLLFFHPMSSYAEFMVSTSVLRNETIWQNGGIGTANSFIQLGSRGINGQSSTSGLDRNSIMFFNLIQKDAVGCWDIRKPYLENNLGIVEQNSTTLIFPNDLKLDHEENQGLWILSNRLPVYLYSQLNFNDVNFRILRTSVRDAIEGTICDPQVLEQ